MRTLKYLLPLLIAPFCFAQGTPNCTLNGSFAANGVSHNFANSTPSCDKWTLTIYNTTLSTFSLTLQSAPAATPSTPGAFVTYIGTTATGSNPLTATGLATFTNGTAATPWLRVSASSITGSGSVYFVLQGSQTVISKGGGGSGGGGPTIAGTTNEITVAGAGCTSPSTATCTISIPSNAALPGAPTTTTATTADNSTKIATTAFVNAEITNSFAGCTFITGSLTCPGSVTSGDGSGSTGALDLVGKTSGATSTLTVDDSNTATQVKLPNDATSGLYFVTTTSPTPAAGCAQFDGISTEATSTSTPCGSGGGGAAGATLFSTTGSTTVTATSPTTLIGAGTGSTTIPANTFTAGQVLEVMAQGYYSTPATPASLTITLNIGGTIRITTGAVVQIASITNGVWRVRCVVTTRTAGSSGTQIANCIFEGTGATLTPGEAPMQTSSAWTIDTTATKVIDLVATWSTATGAPTITSTNVAAWIPGAPVTSVNGMTGAVTVSGGGGAAIGACPSLPSSGQSVGNIYKCNDQPLTYIFISASAAQGFFNEMPITAPTGICPASGGSYTWINQQAGGTCSQVTNGPFIIAQAQNTSGCCNSQLLVTTAPATPYSFTTQIISNFGANDNQQSTSAGFFMGLAIRDSGSGKFSECDVGQGGGFAGGVVRYNFQHWNSPTSGGSTPAETFGFGQGRLGIKLQDDGTNHNCFMSTDGGANWILFYTESRTTFVPSGGNQTGFWQIMFNSGGGGTGPSQSEFFDYTKGN
jgi:hypothetical protein